MASISHAKLQQLFNNEKQKMKEKWSRILNKNWNVVEITQFHRTRRLDVLDMDHVKQTVYEKLGSTVPFIFLNEFYSRVDHVGNIRNVDKGLLILYRFLIDYSIPDMNRFIPKSSYYDIEIELFEKFGDELSSWINTMNDTYFTNPKLRLIGAQLYNPHEFSHVTCYLDGNDTRINYNSKKEIDGFKMECADLYGWKFKKSGGRTQVLYNVNGFFWKFSETAKAGTTNDGAMFEKFKPDRFMTKSDCLCSDGAYLLHVNQILEDNEKKGGGLSTINFCNPIRKIQNVDFELDELQYNEKFGSFRSKIETGFGTMGSVFTKFASTAKHRISNWKIFNLTLRFVCFLLNCRHAIQFFHLNLEVHHGEWRTHHFDFPERDLFTLQPHTPRVEEALENARMQNEYQLNVLHSLIQELEDNLEVEQLEHNYEESNDEESNDNKSNDKEGNDEEGNDEESNNEENYNEQYYDEENNEETNGYISEEFSTPNQRKSTKQRRASFELTPEEIKAMRNIAKKRTFQETQENEIE